MKIYEYLNDKILHIIKIYIKMCVSRLVENLYLVVINI